MSGWTSVLKGYPLEWLLEEEDPSVRYFTLTGLLGKPGNDPEVTAAKKGIMEYGLVTRILEKQSEDGAEYILKHHIFKRSHDLDKVSKPQWLRFGFPLMWNTDILEILGILTKLGYRDERMREAMEVVLSKQDGQGRWKQEDAFSGRYTVSVEKKGKPSKWITFHVLNAIKSYYG